MHKVEIMGGTRVDSNARLKPGPAQWRLKADPHSIDSRICPGTERMLLTSISSLLFPSIVSCPVDATLGNIRSL